MPKPGRNGKSASREVEISKSLSYLLRHAAKKEGLELDEGGWANVADVLAWRRIRSLKVDLSELQSVVATNDKQRYKLEPDPAAPIRAPPPSSSSSKANPTTLSTEASNWRIRAVQGHSIATVSSEQVFTPILLTDANCPDLVVHGTSEGAWKEIEQSGGLKPMRRTHIHFATGLLESVPRLNRDFQSQSKPKEGPLDGVISGMRHGSTVVIWVDVKRSLKGGVKWWRSENNVILTEGVGEPKLLGLEWVKWVEMRGSGKILYWSKVESADVKEMERRMDRLGVGFGDGGQESQDMVSGGERSREKVSKEGALQEKEASGSEDLESAAAVKENWDD